MEGIGGEMEEADVENEDFENEEVFPRVRNKGEAQSSAPVADFAGVNFFQMPPRGLVEVLVMLP
jgi:hypothetical protein